MSMLQKFLSIACVLAALVMTGLLTLRVSQVVELAVVNKEPVSFDMVFIVFGISLIIMILAVMVKALMHCNRQSK